MSHEQMLSILATLGFSEADAQIYTFLAPQNPQTATQVANGLKMNKRFLYARLRRLQQKGIVNCSGEPPKLFSALPIQNVLDILIKTNLEEAQTLERDRGRILACWQDIIKRTWQTKSIEFDLSRSLSQ